MSKLKSRIIIAILVWLGIESTLDRKGWALGLFDLDGHRLIVVINHQNLLHRLAVAARSRIPFQRSHVIEAAEERAEKDAEPEELSPFSSLMQYGSAMPGERDVENFESYVQHITDMAATPITDPRMEGLLAGNRELAKTFGVDFSDEAVWRGALVATYSISTFATFLHEHGMRWPHLAVLSDGTAAAITSTRASMMVSDEDLPDADFVRDPREGDGDDGA